jgi:hypothetical protein
MDLIIFELQRAWDIDAVACEEVGDVWSDGD